MGKMKTLLWKNTLIMKDHKGKYLAIYFSPLLILLLLMLLQKWAVSNFTWINQHPEEISVPSIPRCYGIDCLTIGYVVQGKRQPYIDTVIYHLKTQNGFGDQDVRQMDMRAGEIMDYLGRHPNKTQAVVVFCTNSSWEVESVEVPCFAEQMHLNFYTIIYNLSLYHRTPYMGNLKESYPKDLVTIKLKKDIDEAIIKHYQPHTEIDIKLSDFPSKTSRFIEGFSVTAQYGSFFLMIPYLILLVMESSQLLRQKEKRLRIGLNIVGVTHFQFYFAELLTYAFSVFIISLHFCIAGYLLDFKFWSHGLVWYNMLILFSNGLIIGLLAFIVTACVSDRNLGMSVIYGFVLYSIVMQWLFTGGIILELLYLDSANNIVRFLKYLFNLYPSFHFSKIFSDVNRKADNHLDTYENRFVEGTEFTFNDLFTQASKHYDKPFPHGYVLPSAFESSLYLLATCLLYMLILAILDRTIESNRGTSQLWSIRRRKRKNSEYENSSEQDCLVKIINLQKIYSGEVFALSGVSVQLKKGQIVGLLGQNGAGKSTLINILIGALTKSGGEAIINGMRVEENIVEIRKIIGVCPQFDILWDELTAGEHIEMFLRLKGLPVSEEIIRKSLQSVSLQANVNGRVSIFSGGMRRRMSLAISLLGDPKLVILDEPTTGMDAKVRLMTWRLILKLRKKHTVLLTTHNMQEAECVSDRILIMAKGKITACGTAVELKKQFGQGYIIKGYDRAKDENVVIRCAEHELQAMLTEIEKKNIQNWSLHETTLEEVFLSVTHKF